MRARTLYLFQLLIAAAAAAAAAAAFFTPSTTSTDILDVSTYITGDQTIVSAGGVFELGFFSLQDGGDSRKTYLGIWYANIPLTVVWIANRQNPVIDSPGVLKLSPDDGRLVILNHQKSLIWTWSSAPPPTGKVSSRATAQLLDDGNFVLSADGSGSPESVAWQSFDYPTDTLLPGMKLGVDARHGITRNITSWRSAFDPSPGPFTFKLGAGALPQFFLSMDRTPIYSSGPWNGQVLTGAQNLTSPYFTFQIVSTPAETYYSYSIRDASLVSRSMFVVADGGTAAGELRQFVWSKGEWQSFLYFPYDTCDGYAKCGAFGYCNPSQSPPCTCLPGFEPRSPKPWSRRDWSGGCVRSTKLSCGGGDRFEVVNGIKLPDATDATVYADMTLEQCKEECLRLSKCSCQAYAAANVSGGISQGCVIWDGDLLDIRQNPNVLQDVYIRQAQPQTSSLIASANNRRLSKSVLTIAATVFGVLLLAACCCWFWRSKVTRKSQSEMALSVPSSEHDVLPFKVRMKHPGDEPLDDDRKSAAAADKDVDLPPLFDLKAVLDATDNFAEDNKIGEGGFGPVYKGKLEDGQRVAVKKLAQGSMQGAEEFMNEVILIAKLQHRNLVRLLGCCIEDNERMLVYEYMRNQSLDTFIFDEEKRRLLNWHKRFEIILGIARGLQYLHEDSRFRIIHRDLKASNVLLDKNMIPKISDFGIARMFGGDQTTAFTRRVIGTYGYMAPEYAMDGVISMKSDVFSFGVLVLEIITGKRNRGSYEPDHDLNLLGYAWMMWKEGRGVDLLDEVMGGNFNYDKVLRCIQVALLCVEAQPRDRPLMSTIVMMMASENAMLPEPNEPGVKIGRSSSNAESLQSFTANYVTVTSLQGR